MWGSATDAWRKAASPLFVAERKHAKARKWFARATALEVAYNPNDCVEVRWGAAEGRQERSSRGRRWPPAARRTIARGCSTR